MVFLAALHLKVRFRAEAAKSEFASGIGDGFGLAIRAEFRANHRLALLVDHEAMNRHILFQPNRRERFLTVRQLAHCRLKPKLAVGDATDESQVPHWHARTAEVAV